MLTPADIEKAEFKKVALGYSCDEVDKFLDKVIADFERLYKDNSKMLEKSRTQDELIKYYKDLEDTIRNSIVRSEKNAEETKKNSEIEASQIVKAAEQQAKDILQDANKQLYRLETRILKLKAEYEATRTKLKMLLEGQLGMLQSFELEASGEDRKDN
ncbi:MAG TPA: septum formation initiator [Lachnospiraceae bacterium]|nr:septum formation initiator [Lachnospiraceae bacterium]